MISIIVAHDQNQAIGFNNRIPWKLKDDIKIFKNVTNNKTVIMGRKTYQSIGRPLKNRRNVILTKNRKFIAQDSNVINDGIGNFLNVHNEEIFIIGGSQIYKIFLPHTHKIYLTVLDLFLPKADSYFPKWDKNKFKKIRSEKFKRSSYNQFDFSFEIWEKIQD